MAWYAYCICEQSAFNGANRVRRPFPIEGLRGVAGAQVLGYPCGDLIVVVTEFLRTGTLNQQAAREHALVVSECFRHGTVLPFKFATVFDSEEGMRYAVRANRKAFTRSVAELRGKSEMHIKVVVPMSSLPRHTAGDYVLPTVVGAEYLSKLHTEATHERERQTKARALSQQVHNLFNPLDEDIICRRDDKGGLMIGIAHLIDSEAVAKYQNRFSSATRQIKGCELVLSGPWPPYHFLPQKLRIVHGEN